MNCLYMSVIKYVASALAGTIGFVLGWNIVMNVYDYIAIGLDPLHFLDSIYLGAGVIVSFPSFIGLFGIFIFCVFVSYVHEKIPHCASPWYELFYRFGLMIAVGVFGLFLLFLPGVLAGPVFTSTKFVFILSTSVVSAVSLSVFLILTIYCFEPGKSVRKKGVCVVH